MTPHSHIPTFHDGRVAAPLTCAQGAASVVGTSTASWLQRATAAREAAIARNRANPSHRNAVRLQDACREFVAACNEATA